MFQQQQQQQQQEEDQKYVMLLVTLSLHPFNRKLLRKSTVKIITLSITKYVSEIKYCVLSHPRI